MFFEANCDVIRIGHDVFGTLEKINITVSGGRIHGVGVGGFILGGGYSYLTDEVSFVCPSTLRSGELTRLDRNLQSGLTMDNVISYNIVLPNGTVATASHTSNPELFWGLKGGSNNFGNDTPVHYGFHVCSCRSILVQASSLRLLSKPSLWVRSMYVP